MSEEFRREERFIVVKRKHLTAVQETALRAHMARLDINTVECVVVESDWPEYETVWKMIEDHVTGRATDDELTKITVNVDAGNHDCLAMRRADEPMFILLGRDPDAHNIVRAWANRRLAAGGDPKHCNQALATADRMQAYASCPANAPASAPPAEAYATDDDELTRLRTLAKANNDLARHEAAGRRELQAKNAVLRELLEKARERLQSILAACDQGRMVERGAGGMTIEAQIRRSVYNGVPAWPIEEARDTLAEIEQEVAP